MAEIFTSMHNCAALLPLLAARCGDGAGNGGGAARKGEHIVGSAPRPPRLSFCHCVKRHQALQKRRHVLQRHHVRPVARRVVRVLMRFDETRLRRRPPPPRAPMFQQTAARRPMKPPARPAAARSVWRRISPARRFRRGLAGSACRRPACCSRSSRRARSASLSNFRTGSPSPQHFSCPMAQETGPF